MNTSRLPKSEEYSLFPFFKVIMYNVLVGLSVAGRQCDAGVPHGRGRSATFQEPRVRHQERRDHQRRPRLPPGPDHHHRGLHGQTPQLESQEGTNGLRGLR